MPKVSSSAQLDNYKVTLSVPLIFGEPTLITPVPGSQTTNFGKMFLTFDKEQLKSSGISATFGSSQLYDFDLTYHLENKSLVPVLTSIALPPDTNYQDVIYQRIEPQPLNVTVDEDGNYLAWFRLSRNQKIDVKVIGSAKLFTKSKVVNPSLTTAQRKLYTSPSKYWESDNIAIKNKLTEILKGHENATEPEKVMLIYRYIVNFLKYNPNRLNNNIERFGSVTALNNPTEAVCMEFNDLFISLTRAAGIPARELDGFAYTNNSSLRPLSLNRDILHAWPEYWDDAKGWIIVDPTWENTTQGVDYFNKLDLNHFVFAIKGVSSENPLPAGSYKNGNDESKDVVVTLSDVDFLGKPQIDVDIDMASEVLAGFPGKFKVRVANQGNAVFYPAFFYTSSEKITILNSNQTLGIIPPFGYEDFEYNFRTKSFFDTFDGTILIAVNNQKFDKHFSVKPFFVFKLFPFVFIGIILGMVAIYLLILGLLIYRRRIKKAGSNVKPKEEVAVIEKVVVEKKQEPKPKIAKKEKDTTPRRTFYKKNRV